MQAPKETRKEALTSGVLLCSQAVSGCEGGGLQLPSCTSMEGATCLALACSHQALPTPVKNKAAPVGCPGPRLDPEIVSYISAASCLSKTGLDSRQRSHARGSTKQNSPDLLQDCQRCNHPPYCLQLTGTLHCSPTNILSSCAVLPWILITWQPQVRLLQMRPTRSLDRQTTSFFASQTSRRGDLHSSVLGPLPPRNKIHSCRC
jgi:hypothetical protein